MAYEEYTNVLLARDQPEKSLAVARRARIDPLSVLPTHQLGITYMKLGRFEEAAQEFKEAQQLRPSWLWGYIKRGKALAHLRRCPEALAEEARRRRSWARRTTRPRGPGSRGRRQVRPPGSGAGIPAAHGGARARRFVDPIRAIVTPRSATKARDRAPGAGLPHTLAGAVLRQRLSTLLSIESLASDPRFQELCRRVRSAPGAS